MYQAKCKRCSNKHFWRVRRGKLKCKKCRYEFVPRIGGIRLTKSDWKALLKWFLRCQNVSVVSEETGISKYKILKALVLVRQVMVKDVPDVFEGIVEVDETYLGGQKKNKRKSQLKTDIEKFGKESKRGLGTTKQPVFGILCRSGKVFAELVDKTEAKGLNINNNQEGKTRNQSLFRHMESLHRPGDKRICPPNSRAWKKEYVKGKNHINGLEGFWGYLKRQLASRGGIRKERLPYYLAEYVWRYNYRKLPVKKQVERLLNLVAKI